MFTQISDFYTPQRVIGCGSFASVVLCVSNLDQNQYAVKTIKKDSLDNNELNLEIFANEV